MPEVFNPQLPRWRSHKVVQAAPIIEYIAAGDLHCVWVDMGGGRKQQVNVPANFTARGGPIAGDYLVVYDEGQYLSWSPKTTFEDGYHAHGASLRIGEAMLALKGGDAIARDIWMRRFMIVLAPGSRVTVEADRPLGVALPEVVGEAVDYAPHIDMFDKEQGRMTPWTPTAFDLLADDFRIVGRPIT